MLETNCALFTFLVVDILCFNTRNVCEPSVLCQYCFTNVRLRFIVWRFIFSRAYTDIKDWNSHNLTVVTLERYLVNQS